MREEFSTFFPLNTHDLLRFPPRLVTEAREKLTFQEKLAFAGIRTPDVPHHKVFEDTNTKDYRCHSINGHSIMGQCAIGP
ncbi:unnamed protein product [Ectocarpus sp. 12 AP-2014]